MIQPGPMTRWQKQIIIVGGLFLALPGFPLLLGFICGTLALVAEKGEASLMVGLVTFILAAITIGAGSLAFWHGTKSMEGRESKVVTLPSASTLAGVFVLLVAGSWFISKSYLLNGLLFPPVFVVAAALPPLAALSWFAGVSDEGLTWRRVTVAFAGGATISVAIAVLLEFLFPLFALTLISNLASFAIDRLETLFKALAGQNVAQAITDPGFIYIFIQIAIIAPLAEEIAKPLVVLPLVKYLSRRQVFLIGAAAGAGFAAMENILYAGFGLPFWGGILLVRALGGAVHPLGAGLVALGWRDILQGNPNAGSRWLIRFGAATGLHALWNGGSLLVIALAGAEFFGELPPAMDILGLSTAGTTLALLMILGLAALGLGRWSAQGDDPLTSTTPAWQKRDFILSNRTIAIWAFTCLAAIVPVGITGLKLLLG